MWTNEEINRLKSQHGHGWSVEESADILERSPLDVRNKLIALGLKPIEETTPAPKKTARKRKHKLKESGRTNPHKIPTIKPADTKPAENWVLGQLENISNLMKNVKDVKEIGYALGRLDMLITVLKEDERRHDVR